MAAASRENKGMHIDFYADWCGPCQMMEAQVFSDPEVQKHLPEFVCVKVDTDRDRRTAFLYQAFSIPRVIVLNVHRQVVGDLVGFVEAARFVKFLEDAKPRVHRKLEAGERPVGGGPPPTKAEHEAKPAVVVDANTSPERLVELLADRDPEVRSVAREEALRREPDSVESLLVEMLRADYLGSRIAALETLKRMEAFNSIQFDPWADKDLRARALESSASR